MKQIIIIAGVGYLGTRAASKFIASGDSVYGLCRNKENSKKLQSAGIIPIFADLETGEGLERLPAADCAVFCAAPDGREETDYRNLYLSGMSRFLNALKRKSRKPRFIYTSSTSVWGNGTHSGFIDEKILPVPGNEKGRILLESESQALAWEDSVVLRLAGLYGPARNRLAMIIKGLPPRRGENHIVNLIHLEDAAQAVVLASSRGVKGEIYIVCDNEPAASGEIDAWLKQKTGLPPPGIFPVRELQGKRLSNRKIRDLGLEFIYPHYRSGYESIIKDELTEALGTP